MKRLTKLFTLLLAVCLLCGIVAIATSAVYTVDSTNQLVIPAKTDESGKLISGNYAYNDGTTTGGWTDGNSGGTAYYNWDTSNGYINFTQKLSKKVGGNTADPYIEWNLSAGNHNTAGMYKMNLTDYGYSVVDFEFGTNAYKAQIGYHVYYSEKNSTTKECRIEPMYKTFVEISDADLQKAIDDNYTSFLADVEAYQAKGFLADANAADESYKWTLAEAKASKTLALDPGTGPYLVLRSMNKLGLTDYANGKLLSAYVQTYVVADNEGNYYLADKDTYNTATALVPIEGINDYKHITVVCKISDDKYVYSVFVDGEFMYSTSFAIASYPAMYLDAVRLNIRSKVKLSDGFSFVMDNMTSNFYEKGYASGDALGVDDLFNGNTAIKTTKLYELSDVVYSKSYQGVDGIVTIGGKTYNNSADAYAAIAGLKGSASFKSTMALYNVEIPEDIDTLIVESNNIFTLSENSKKTRVIEKQGNYYLIRYAEEEEYLPVNWYDGSGNLIKTDKILPDVMPEIEDYDPTYVNTETGMFCADIIEGWYFNISGSEEAARPLTAEEAENLEAISIYAKVSETVETQLLYYIGVYDKDSKTVKISPSSAGDYEAYKNASTFRTEIEAAKSGSTVVILSDLEIAPVGSINISAGKEISVDLNGHDLMALQGARTQGQGTFVLYEGSAINIYSSREGGRIFDARAYYVADTVTLNGVENTAIKKDYQAYAISGFVSIKETVDAATVNIGAYRGYAANLEYNGGSLVWVKGTDFGTVDPDDSSRKEILGGGKRIINVDGGKYYLIARPSYGMFVATGADAVFNIKNADFYSPNGTYSIFQDYGTSTGTNSTTKYPRFTVNSVYNISNCNILGVNVDNISKDGYKVSSGVATNTGPIAGAKDGYAKLFYEIAADSVAYIDNSVIVAQIYQTVNGKIYLGEGNVIATNSDITKLKIVDGVTSITADSSVARANNVTLSYAHPAMYNDFDTFLQLKEGQTNYYVMIPGVFDGEDVVATASKPIKLVTYKDAVPELARDFVAAINWYDPDGALYATTYEFIGDNVAPYDTDKFPKKELDNGWYDIGYSGWVNAVSGVAEDYLVTAGENKFTPKAGLVAEIEEIQIGMKLSVTEYDFYIYIPKPGDDSIEYNHKGDPTKGIGFYFGATATVPYGWTNATTPDTSVQNQYLTNTTTHYTNHFYIANNNPQDYERSIRFLATYDINGDGEISADETDILLSYNINLSVIKYSRAVIRIYGHDSDEATLAYEIVRYLQESARYTKKDVATTDEKAQVFYDEYYARCTCDLGYYEDGTKKCAHVLNYDEVEYEDYDADTTELKDYMYGASFTLEISKPFLEFYVKKIDGVTYSFELTYDTYTKKDGVVTYGPLKATVTNKGDKTITVNGESVTATNYRVSNMRGYDTNSLYTIKLTVTDASGTKVLTGSYSLGQYIESNPDVRVAKALYVYSIACREYYLVRANEQ